ncbi:unnamed protein product [Schistosoma margrebowiei]|uniref:Uncharacterized protein n=1 Tax=Schistosoma margrebowiei TaxID=48269 RepID=A0A183L9K1_9TREM|nr:unnamed protein product [Schistosoma margrebowiei]
MIHNQPCDEKCLKNDPWFRRLSEDHLKVFLPMVKTGSCAESIVKYAEEDFEKTITVNYKHFQLVCTDNCGYGVPVMFALTKEEKNVDVVWILDHFKKIINGISQTETFVMDCARSIISAVELKHRTAHIAPFHVCRAMCKKTRNPIIKQYLCQLVREQTVAKFNQTRGIISVRSRRITAYLNKNWVNRKETWAAAFNSNVVTLGNNTNNRVESAHRQLKRKLSNRDALIKCM